MKKHILIMLSIVCAGILMVGCANDGTGTSSTSSTTTTTVKYAEPGTIEPMPSEVNILIKAKEQLKPAENEIVFFYWRDATTDEEYKEWAIWFWATGSEGANNWDAISKHGFDTVTIGENVIGYMKFNSEGTDANGCIPVTDKEQEAIKNKGTFNFIVRKKSSWDKDYDGDLKWELMEGNYFGQISGKGEVYSIADDAKPQIMNAVMLTANEILVGLSQKFAVYPYPASNGFSVESESGNKSTIKDVYFYGLYGDPRLDDKSKNFRYRYNYQKQFVITMKNKMDFGETWYLKHKDFMPAKGIKLNAGSAAKNEITALEYKGDDLGVTINGTKASFKVFAPLATTANVVLFDTYANAQAAVDNSSGLQKTSDRLSGGTRVAMSKASDFAITGVWEKSDVDIGSNTYYVYELDNLGTVYRVCDINALVAGPDSIAAQLVDINDASCKPTGWETDYTNPFGTNGKETKSYTDAVIYEMHIRDWSKGLSSSNTGKFDEITAGLANGAALSTHLKDLGITHVQILPMFDYAQTNSDTGYNWGYNPYHYNVPEGRYVTNMKDGSDAVKQMRAMIKAFHDNGIAVNMDVVYNHTNGTSFGSLYDMTVPYYYYRLDYGAYSNGSGCGNETDSSMPMYKKYMIDSLKHWMKDYHINGFRFDLMGLHEAETMAEIYVELAKIDKNVMVYGEPWTGGTSPVKNSSTKAGAVGNAGYGAFDDDFRNAIKGGEFGGFEKGQVQGNFENEDKLLKGLEGKTSRNDTGRAGLSLHYVECHDNYTLFDKLDISILDGTDKTAWKDYKGLSADQQNAIRAQNKLAAAYIFLAQGTPFINGGQEFMRTKKGDENSYISSDNINAIDLTFKTTYNDVYLVYKGLIALRHFSDAFTAATSVSAEKEKEGVTKYTVKGSSDEYCIYFNATSSDADITTDGYSKAVDVTSGTPTESTTLPKKVGAKNFVILKKE